MLIPRETLLRIVNGEVTLAFRRWRRPSVKTGGRLLTRAGQLEIRSVESVDPDTISAEDATRAGHASRESLLAVLNARDAGEVYRIEFGRLQPDPRLALREAPLDEESFTEVRRRLQRLDAASPLGPWTLATLRAIRGHPGLRAGDLCQIVGQERSRFKPNVRKLKNLGLTISLEVGYRLSPRGEAYLERAREAAAAPGPIQPRATSWRMRDRG